MFAVVGRMIAVMVMTTTAATAAIAATTTTRTIAMTMTTNEENLPLYNRSHHSNTHYRYISHCGCDRNREKYQNVIIHTIHAIWKLNRRRRNKDAKEDFLFQKNWIKMDINVHIFILKHMNAIEIMKCIKYKNTLIN